MTRYLAQAIVNQEVYLSCFRGTRKPCQSPTNKDQRHEDEDMDNDHDRVTKCKLFSTDQIPCSIFL